MTVSFEEELRQVINRHSAESVSGTPDYLLAKLLLETLKTFNDVVTLRAEWRGESCELPALLVERPRYKSPLRRKQSEKLWQALGGVFGTAPNSEEACHELERVVAEMINRG